MVYRHFPNSPLPIIQPAIARELKYIFGILKQGTPGENL